MTAWSWSPIFDRQRSSASPCEGSRLAFLDPFSEKLMKTVLTLLVCVLFVVTGCQGKPDTPPPGGATVPVPKGAMPKGGKQPRPKVEWK